MDMRSIFNFFLSWILFEIELNKLITYKKSNIQLLNFYELNQVRNFLDDLMAIWKVINYLNN